MVNIYLKQTCIRIRNELNIGYQGRIKNGFTPGYGFGTGIPANYEPAFGAEIDNE
jgi:hypothetical protein